MLARLQQSIVAAIVIVSLTGAWLAVRFGRPAWAPVPMILIACGYAAVLAGEFAFVRVTGWRSGEPLPTLALTLRAWLSEIANAPRVFLWRQPFRSKAHPDRLRVDTTNRRGVVLVHGFVCNRGLWNAWTARLERDGVPFIAVDLEPVFGSIDDYVAIVDVAARRVSAATGGLAPLIVAHSMGGLAVRAWIARRGVETLAHRVMTIATPHRGTLIACASSARNATQMRPASPWLVALRSSEATNAHARFTCFWSRCDNIVAPSESATLPHADNRELVGVAHVCMVDHPEVYAEARRLLASD